MPTTSQTTRFTTKSTTVPVGAFAPKDEVQEAVEVKSEPFKPVRVWTAGPGLAQEKIFIPGSSSGLRPNRDGSYSIRSQEQYEQAKKALGNRFWEDNVPEDEEALKCELCGWVCRNYRAMNVHTNQAHGRPQTV